MEEKKDISLGNLEFLELDIAEPIKMKMERFEYKHMIILVGQNGTGKTLLLKLTWLMATHVNFVAAARKGSISFNEQLNMQTLFDNVFTKNNFSGRLKVEYTCGTYMEVSLENGKITLMDTNISANILPGAAPVFMSKEVRLFDEHIKYLKLKKMLGIPKGFPSKEDDLIKLLDMYRIYDIMFLEQFFHKIENKIPAGIKQFAESINGFDNEMNITDINMDYDSSDILYSTDKVANESVTTLGAGHQAIMTQFGFLSL